MANNSAKRQLRKFGSRARAACCVTAVFEGHSLDRELAEQQAGLSEEDQRFLQALVYGCLRDWRLLQWFARQLMDRPPRKSAARLEALICVGIFQLRSLNQPARAVVHSSVEAARELRMDWAAGLVNAVLRRYQREHTALESELPDDPGIRFSHPKWLVRQFEEDWPQDWQELLAANNQPGPMWLRVNRLQGSRDDYFQMLLAAGIDAEACADAPDALRLQQAMPVTDLPGFASGAVSVQDAAAQMAGLILNCQPGQRLLDACAAPGGKTGHMLEQTPDLDVLALDKDARRLQRVEENLQRLQLTAETRAADAADPQAWWDGRGFDRILLDAPCSGTGVIRRHPDIKWLRRASDIPALAERQLGLLQALWPTLAPGGQLLYASCSVLRAEGDAVIEAFLKDQADAVIQPINGDWGEPAAYGRRIATGQQAMDGFYYALLIKRVDGIASDVPK